jgi:hypothetical protein
MLDIYIKLEMEGGRYFTIVTDDAISVVSAI